MSDEERNTSPERAELRADVDAVVVGAGFGGLYAHYRLREQGLSVVGFEAGSGVGGTWFWNRYPGARCDIQSMYYSYSFSPELEQEWEWTERYPSQPELLTYLNHVADRFDLRRDIRFDTRVTSAVYDEQARRWKITTDRGDEVWATYFVTAVGCLSEPKVPDIDGLDDFGGQMYRTSRWPHEGVDLEGKRVAVIGTGSTGVQVTPVVAEQASQLFVFQRTPSFVLPARNAPLDAEEQTSIKAKYREIRQAQRESGFGIPWPAPTQSALEVDEEVRREKYEFAWNAGRGGVTLLGSFKDLGINQAANDTAAEFMRSKVRGIVKDPVVAEALCPTTYPLGTKRMALDTNYYESFNRDNVTLVDVRQTPIVSVTETGIKTTDAEYDVDVIILAIGFDALTGPLLAMDIQGVGGQTLRQKWEDGPHTYLGLGMAGFPNLFTITGPLSPSVLGNVVVCVEHHVEWIGDCIAYMREHDLKTIEAKPEAEQEWVDRLSRMASKTLMSKANSWYVGANIPGKPKVFMAYLGGVAHYQSICQKVADNGYDGFVLAE